MSLNGKVTVVGAGFYGSTTAQRLAEYNVFETVVLTDILEGRAEGLALDLNQSRPIEGFETTVIGQTTDPATGAGYEATADSDVVVITAGLPRKPGMSRMDLIETNARIVRNVAENVVAHSPNAVIVVVSNPLDEMTALASERYDRSLVYGLRAHMIVRETETEARAAAERLVSRLDPDTGDAIRNKSLDAASVGVQRQASLRESAADDGFVEEALWTGVGRARSGAGAAIVGDPDQVLAKLRAYQEAGIGAFILSGYPHIAECDLVAEHVLPRLDHAALKPRWTP